MRTKNVIIGTLCAALLATTTACGHKHTAAEGWQSDLKDHWQVCECGEKMEVQEHALEDALCKICGNEIIIFDDGTAQLSVYDADGNVILSKMYENEVLLEETEYVVGSDADGSWSMGVKTTLYNEDGSCSVTESDPDGQWSTETIYDAEGKVVEEYRYEYEYNEDGEATGSKSYKDGELVEEVYPIVNEAGESTGILWTTYNEDGTKSVIEYDENFEMVKETLYDAEGNEITE